ncbi:MAG: site-2 protease family protein [Chloroflexota bacterium]|nr:site-2 protease family protein [Chloroflexota bacterium]
MLGNSVRLFTVRGIEVGVHYSWLIIFGLFTWILATSAFPEVLGRHAEVESWVLAAITVVLMFVSVLIHELAHSFVALARGLKANSITLFAFGGVSSLSGDAKEASTEFLVAIVGPLTSFALAGIAYGVASIVNETRIDLVFSYLAYINFALGVFNLVPGYPLDGGRVLRSILWGITNNVRKATEWAGNVGKVVAWGMFAFGLFQIFNGQYVNGIWLAAIAWFLHNAASNSVQQIVLETRLRRVRARDVVTRDEVTVAPGTSVAELIDHFMLPSNRGSIAVTDNGRLVGIVSIRDILKVPPAERSQVMVAQVMSGQEGLLTIAADARVQDAVELLAEHDLEQLPVMDGLHYVGMLTRADVMRQLQLREALDV